MPKREEREKKNRKEVGGKTTPRGVQVLKNTLLDNKQPGWEGAAGSLWGGGGGRACCSAATSGGLIPSWSRSAEGSPGVGTWGLGEGQISKGDFQLQMCSVVLQVETWKMTPPFWKALSEWPVVKIPAPPPQSVAHLLYLCFVILFLRG